MIAAVITAYKPDAEFASRFAPLLSVCKTIIVSDNTPGGHPSFDLPAGFTVIQNLTNVGLAPALNLGLAEAARQGAQFAILFDQDSTPSAAFVSQMSIKLAEATAQHGPHCCVGPTHVDDGVVATPDDDSPKTPASADEASSREVACLPTSGMIIPLGELTPSDLFSDDFFLDLVDFEWCWRLRRRGWHFLRSGDAQMLHRLGVAQRRFLGFTFHVPAPYRHYFQVRDTLRLAFRDYVPSYAKVRLIGVLPIKALVYPFILDHGLERICWMARGVLDSFRGVTGMGAASARLSK
jgi:rhamnosyltransferase